MHADEYLREVADIAERISRDDVERLAVALHTVRERKGRVFVIGLGGSYANAEHCAADLRKLCDIEAYAPNVAEMSAWENDAGQMHGFEGHTEWMSERDALLVLSVGGGTATVSEAITNAVEGAKLIGAAVLGVVGPNGGTTYKEGHSVVRIPAPGGRVTPHTEAFQAVVWHLLVSHPMLQRRATKW